MDDHLERVDEDNRKEGRRREGEKVMERGRREEEKNRRRGEVKENKARDREVLIRVKAASLHLMSWPSTEMKALPTRWLWFTACSDTWFLQT